LASFYFLRKRKHDKTWLGDKQFSPGHFCFKKLKADIIKLAPKAKLGINYHFTILHSDPEEIWIHFYNNSKFPNFVRDEPYVKGKECKKFHIEESEFNPNDPKKEKYSGTLPTLSELKNL
jgi:hypothetical protein